MVKKPHQSLLTPPFAPRGERGVAGRTSAMPGLPTKCWAKCPVRQSPRYSTLWSRAGATADFERQFLGKVCIPSIAAFATAEDV